MVGWFSAFYTGRFLFFSLSFEILSQWWAGSLNGGMIFPELEMSPSAMVGSLHDGGMVFYLKHWSIFVYPP